MAEIYETLTYEVKDRVGIVTFTRPKQRNAFSQELKDDLLKLFRARQHDSEIGAMIITGSDGVFSAGGDLKSLNATDRPVDRDRRRIYQVHDWFQVLLNLEIPVIAAVDGPAYGGGFGLALGADFILVSERARLCCVFSRIGLVPDVGCLFTLPRIVGLQKAKEIVYTNRPIFAEEAKQLGIAMEIHPHETLMDEAMALARRLTKASTAAIGCSKRILNQSFNLDAQALVEMEAAAQAVFFATAYHKDAVANFVNKQPMDFNWEAMDAAERGGG